MTLHLITIFDTNCALNVTKQLSWDAYTRSSMSNSTILSEDIQIELECQDVDLECQDVDYLTNETNSP